MKAIIYDKYGPPDVLQLREVVKPVPEDNEVLIKIHATTVTTALLAQRSGNPLMIRFFTGLFGPRKTIPGQELAGEIETVGKDVERFKKGDKVFANSGPGSTAEYMCIPEDAVVIPKPDNMTYEEAAPISEGVLTALPFLRDAADIQKGQRVLIYGASGGIGTYAVQLAKHYQAEVTGLCSTANLEMVKSLGADRVIDYTTVDFTKNGETYDIIFDTVGKSSFKRCKNSLKKNGMYLTTVPTGAVYRQMLWTSVIGSKKAIIKQTGLRSVGDKIKDLLFVKELIEAGEVKTSIDKIYPLEQTAEAHSYVEKGHKKGNVVISVVSNGDEDQMETS